MAEKWSPEWIAALGRKAETALGDPDRAYRRPGSWRMLTGEQWEAYDGLSALRERQAPRFGEEFATRISGGLGVTRGRMLL